MKLWPTVVLGDCLAPSGVQIAVSEADEYPNAGIYSYARGLFHKPPISGLKTSAMTLTRVSKGDFIYSRLFAFEGAYSVVTDEFDGCYLSNEYPSFRIDTNRLHPGFLKAYFKQPRVWTDIARGSIGVGFRRQRVQPAQVLKHSIPLPPLAEQQAIVTRLDTLADKSRQVNAHLDAIEADADRLLAVRFRDAIASAAYTHMSEIAPSVRRHVEIDISTRYREVGARSFGKGLFTKPEFDGAEATWEKPVWIAAGDLVLSNIKAWEGAIAVAGESHAGCIASHRYITCVPRVDEATARFLAYFLLSPDGLEQIGLASPGTADRNRTLSLTSLGKIEVPVPPISTQRAFDALQSKVAELKAKHSAIRAANQALIPARLERIFGASEPRGTTA